MINLLLAALVTVSNPASINKKSIPVVMQVDRSTVSARVMQGDSIEIPCQLDDLNDDGIYDELAFLTDMKSKEVQTFKVYFNEKNTSLKYTPRTYAAMSMKDRDTKAAKPKHLPATSITVPASSDAFQYIFPHGPVIENELVGFRIYSDHRQSVDYYGHKSLMMDIAKTDFYPTKEQVKNGSGDDVLYTGSTQGCGALMGWDGKNPVMFKDVRNTTYAVVTSGPIRAILDITNKGWKPSATAEATDIRTRYILYAGHRDVEVQVQFSRDIPELKLSTGIVDIVGSEQLTDNGGLRGCWGTACAGNNPAVYDTHTVGLGICVPGQYYKGDEYYTNGKENLPDQAYTQLVGTKKDNLHYWFTATCDMETFTTFKTKDEWFDYLKKWKKELAYSPKIVITNN